MQDSKAERTGIPRRRRSALIRSSDRVERAVLVVAVLITLAALPFAAALGSDTYPRVRAAIAAEDGGRHQTTATLLKDATTGPLTPGVSGTRMVPVQAEWLRPDGSTRRGTIDAETRTPRGRVVTIWLDATGQPVPAPRTAPTAAWEAIAVAVTAWISVAAVCASVFAATRWRLNRARYRRWERDWQDFDREHRCERG